MVDDAIQPCRPARPGRENIVPEPFSENPPLTMRHLANEPPRDNAEAYFFARTGQIRSCLSYRLGIRLDLAPHNGHSATPLSARTAIIIESDESLTLSITNLLGTSDEIRMPARKVLIPPLENRKLGRKHHQI